MLEVMIIDNKSGERMAQRALCHIFLALRWQNFKSGYVHD